ARCRASLLTALLFILLGGTLQAQNWYIPIDLSAIDEPMIFVNFGDPAPEGYFLADQACAQEVFEIDDFCSITDWDDVCQDRYNRCLYGVEGCSGDWFIPDGVGLGPIVFACSAPAGYSLAVQTCAQQVVNGDPFCVDTNWDSVCASAYNCCLGNFGCGDFGACNYDPTLCADNALCTYPGCTNSTACNYDATAGCDDGSCELPEWWIPIVVDDVTANPMIGVCEGETAPAGYILADQSCAQELAEADSFCTDTDWDFPCQNSYNRCLYNVVGCFGTGAWYIPDVLYSGPIVFACDTPEGYSLANQNCAQQVVNEDPFCVNSQWDEICAQAYNCCLDNYGCNNPSACNYDIELCPDNSLCVFGPSNDECLGAIELASGVFTQADNTSSCINGANPSCGGPSQIQDLWFSYTATINGTIVFQTLGGSLSDTRSAVYSSCFGAEVLCNDDHVNGDTFVTDSRLEFTATAGDTYYFQTGGFESNTGSYSVVVFEEGVGCTDVDACNYDPFAIYDSGSCEVAGCTYSNATNYDPNASCEDGSCEFDGVSSCLGDFNNDDVVNGSDLLTFLSAFGSLCN
ncbi:MAG: hypothetical protein AAF193_04380, partial [Bacteroidota bacterium]